MNRERLGLYLFCGWLAFVPGVMGYCWLVDKPLSLTAHLLLASSAVPIAIFALGIATAVSTRERRHLRTSLLAVAGLVLLLLLIYWVDASRKALALKAAETAVLQYEPGESPGFVIEDYAPEEDSLFLLLRSNNGRLFGVTLREEGRSFLLYGLVEHDPRDRMAVLKWHVSP